ncbi:LacI family transcriptional regulator [Polaribacter reichenbachii]|uniref:LacI family transcriptional regulator n=1 Tax=Polaribacter reichenbachii TaxID=996801 RepID=A0A1B8TV46_9FLAO|nr:LacI family DNA-binding transcriptional regulator [Polaribacter reichenbachii]APZ45594.1 LacI family transcriptional regulator [Polaribacter reichenbachii]AUC19456.1 LacI family transcriptional regulator [Polaribacter reichenbachii]OBY63389.1 LacI family transcriptional regulator [Polaribacter reichenbachii]
MVKKNKTTIKDIANVLNISAAAVSKALHNDSRISEKTKKAVRQVAKNLNYQPNHLASALRSGKSNLVGVIVPKTNSNFFSATIHNIEEVLNEKGYNIIITQSNESFEKECKNIDTLLYTQVDGIIASMANETVNLEYYEKIKAAGIPLITFDRGENDLNVDYIGIDDYESSHTIVNHLVAQGCKRIAHIGGYKRTRIFNNRIRGYVDALKKHNLPLDEELLLESSLTIEDGREKMKQLLALENKPDAVYVAGDYAALGALQILKENDVKIPEEIALVGFGDEPFSAMVTPSITSINQHSYKIGRIAAETFLEYIKKPKIEQSLNKIILESDLIIRASSLKKK